MFIWLDMDGTIAQTYNVENWLDYLHNEMVYPYVKAAPLGNMRVLARQLNLLHKKGYKIGIISWGSRNGSSEYMQAVQAAKKEWLNKHLKSVQWDEIHIVEYGTPKENFRTSVDDILFDDDERNRAEWGEMAFSEKELFEVLRML